MKVSVERDQPVALDVLSLSYNLESMMESLGLYLLTAEQNYLEDYHQRAEKIDSLLQRVSGAQLKQDFQNPSELDKQDIEQLITDISSLKSVNLSLLPLAKDPLENYPGLRHAQEKLSPIGMEMLNVTSQMILYSAYSSMSSEQLKILSDVEREEYLQAMSLLSEINTLRQRWTGLITQIRGYLSYQNEAVKANLYQYHKAIDEQLDKIKKYKAVMSFEQEDMLDEFETQWERFQVPFNTLIKIYEGDDWRTDASVLRQKVGPLLKRIHKTLDVIADNKRHLIETQNKNMLQQIEQNILGLIVLDILGVVFGLIVISVVIQLIQKRLGKVVTAMNEVSQGSGNLNYRLDDKGNDEMSQLASGFNAFVFKVKGVIDLVIESSVSLSSEAGSMSSNTEKTKQGALKQQMESQQVSEAFHEMSRAMAHVQTSSEDARSFAQKANSETNDGQRVVNNTVDAIRDLVNDVARAASVMETLVEEANGINEVVTVIQDITEQTSLLALNAAIEAARAGEQGRGFAVVADEVRNLANRTQKGTKQIEEKISSLQSVTGEAVSALSRGQEQATSSMEKAEKAGEALQAIQQMVSGIAERLVQIYDAVEEQKQLSSTVDEKISSISRVAEETADNAMQTANSSHELSLMAGQLEGLVTQFLLKNETAPVQQKAAALDKATASDDVTLF